MAWHILSYNLHILLWSHQHCLWYTIALIRNEYFRIILTSRVIGILIGFSISIHMIVRYYAVVLIGRSCLFPLLLYIMKRYRLFKGYSLVSTRNIYWATCVVRDIGRCRTMLSDIAATLLTVRQGIGKDVPSRDEALGFLEAM